MGSLSNDANSDTIQIIETLEAATRPELVDRWRSLYRSKPPKGVSQRFLMAAIAHALQMRAQGRSLSSVQRRIQRAITKADRPSEPKPTSTPLTPGALLIREWNGATYTVDITDDGFVWDGVPYRSLSAIARAITGARWSGPRFFGLSQDNSS